MDLYIDKENLLSLITNDRESDIYNESLRLIRHHLRLKFNFSKLEASKDDKIRTWLMKFGTTGRQTTEVDTFTEDMFPGRPLKTNFCTNHHWEVFSSVYLLNDEKIDTIKSLNALLINGLGEELNIINKLFCDNKFELFAIYNPHEKTNFNEWNQLLEDGHIMPCSDIIIADRYLFSGKRADWENNILKFIKLFAIANSPQKINILFFIDDITKPNQDYVRQSITSMFEKRASVRITFIRYNNDRPHDRFIITNYRYFESGDSFNNYFTSNGRVSTQGYGLKVHSMAHNKIYQYVKGILSHLQSICDKNPERIDGNKESNFISFNKSN